MVKLLSYVWKVLVLFVLFCIMFRLYDVHVGSKYAGFYWGIAFGLGILPGIILFYVGRWVWKNILRDFLKGAWERINE